MNKIKNIWHAIQNYVHQHEKVFHHVHNLTHLGYFGMVATHGPYYYPAGILLVLGFVGYVLHIGVEEV